MSLRIHRDIVRTMFTVRLSALRPLPYCGNPAINVNDLAVTMQVTPDHSRDRPLWPGLCPAHELRPGRASRLDLDGPFYWVNTL